jgi:hypothetical protein
LALEEFKYTLESRRTTPAFARCGYAQLYHCNCNAQCVTKFVKLASKENIFYEHPESIRSKNIKLQE